MLPLSHFLPLLPPLSHPLLFFSNWIYGDLHNSGKCATASLRSQQCLPLRILYSWEPWTKALNIHFPQSPFLSDRQPNYSPLPTTITTNNGVHRITEHSNRNPLNSVRFSLEYLAMAGMGSWSILILTKWGLCANLILLTAISSLQYGSLLLIIKGKRFGNKHSKVKADKGENRLTAFSFCSSFQLLLFLSCSHVTTVTWYSSSLHTSIPQSGQSWFFRVSRILSYLLSFLLLSCFIDYLGWINGNWGFFFFRDRVSLYRPGYPGTHFVDQAGLELRNPPASASRVLGSKAWATTARELSFDGCYFSISLRWRGDSGGLNMIGPGSGTMRRCGLVGGSMSLWGWSLRPSSLPVRQSSSVCLWTKIQNSQFLQCHACLNAAILPIMLTVDWNSEPVSQPQLNVVLYKNCLGHGVSSGQ
jgi:hypothetical protein